MVPEAPSQKERNTIQAIQEESGTKGNHNKAGGATSEQQARNRDLFSNISLAHNSLATPAASSAGRPGLLQHSHRHARIGRARSAGGRTGPAQTGPRALPSPQSAQQSGCLRTAPGAHQPRLPAHSAPSLPPHCRPLLQGKQRTHLPRQRPCGKCGGDGRQRSEASAPIGCVPGGGRAQRAPSRPIGRRGSPARAGRAKPPPPRVTRVRPWRAQKTLPAARGGLAPPPRPAASAAAASPPRSDT